MNNISEFYTGKKLFVTGATGFCGKLLIEKLLRTCCDLECIYILIRTKKNEHPNQRLLGYKSHVLFDHLRKTNPKQLDKVRVVSGDISSDGLGLSREDETELIENVNVVFHCAATTRFDEKLKNAVNINTAGTLRILQLTLKMRKLQIFSYTSTAFSHCYQKELEERHYSTLFNPFEFIENVKTMTNDAAEQHEIDILNLTGYPNTYTLSKALAEDLVYFYRHQLPIVVLRPSIVLSVHGDHLQGYIESFNGPAGITCGSMTGMVRTAHVTEDCLSKITPVDFVASSQIVSVVKRSTVDKILYFNCCDAETNPMTWYDGMKLVVENYKICPPLKNIIWYPNLQFTTNFVWYIISLILFQLLPACAFDLMFLLKGQKPQLLRLQKKIITGMFSLKHFMTNRFVFETVELQKLFGEMNSVDKAKFDFDHTRIDWKQYTDVTILEARRLLLKEDPKSIPEAIEKMKRLWLMNVAVKIMFSGLLLYCLAFVFLKCFGVYV